MSPRVAFLGLGTMGLPMARNLAHAELPLLVWNRSPSKLEAWSNGGVASTPAEAAAAADIVVTMLTGGDALEAVLFGEAGAATAPVRGKLFVDMSTTGPAAAHKVAARLAALQAAFVDAPVSGSRAPAEKAELVVLAGGQAEDIDRARSVFAAVARAVIVAGPVGAGQTLKVVLNGMGCQQLLAFASMLRLGERAGLSRAVLLEAFSSGAFATPAYAAKRSRVLQKRYGDPDFVLELVLRDAELCAELQRELGVELPTHLAARQEVARAVAQGFGSRDLFCVEELYSDFRTGEPK